MARKPFRIEVNYPTKGTKKCFLVRDIQVNKKRRKVRISIGSTPPDNAQEMEKLRRSHGLEMSLKVAKAKARLSQSQYHSKFLSNEQMQNLEWIRWLYQGLVELMTTNEVELYERMFEVSYIQGTTSIEGNTMTLGEARDLLEYNLSPKNKTLREINEVQNFRQVVKFRNQYRGNVSLDFIRILHTLIMNNIDTESAGTFRRVNNVGIHDRDLILTPAMMIESELQEAIDTYYSGLDAGVHPFELAFLFHHRFESIHPFNDGNGRVGREILNLMLRRGKYPRLLFLGKDRRRYLDALRAGDEDRFGDMLSTFASLISDQRLSVLEGNMRSMFASRRRIQARLEDWVQSS